MSFQDISKTQTTYKPSELLSTTSDSSIPEKDTDTSNVKTTFINPTSSNNLIVEGNLIWIEMRAIPIDKLSNNVRAPNTFLTKGKDIKKGSAIAEKMNAPEYIFKFLSSQELMEQLNHTWEAYDSWAASLSQAYAEFGITMPENIKGLISSTGQDTLGAAGKYVFNEIKEAVGSGKLMKIYDSFLSGLSAGAKGGAVANTRVDTPLQYKGSERRSFELTFTLINLEEGKNHENVVLPVKLLQMFSSPSFREKPDAKANADILLPYLFELKTTPGDLFYVDLAILKSVQPTWRGPWINGYPSRCDLRLSFMEYRPLEQALFYGTSTKYSKIKTIQKERSGADAGRRREEVQALMPGDSGGDVDRGHWDKKLAFIRK